MTVEDLEKLVTTLPASDFRRFAEWFDAFKASQWDEQIARDATAGKLDHLIHRAKADYAADLTKPL